MTIPASGPISFSQIRNELVLTGSVSLTQLISNNNPWSNIPAAEQAYAITDFVTPYDYDELAPITVDYDTHNDKILIAGNIYDDDNYGGYVHMLVIGSVSGTSISYTPIQIAGTDENFGNGYDSTVLYMPTNNKIVFLYNNYGTVVLKIGYLSSATAVTWNNTYNLGSGSSAGVSANLIQHPTINNKFFVLYKRNNTTKIVPYTVDSSGAAVAGVTTTLSISYANKPAWAWDIQNDRLVLAYIDGANLKAQVGQFTAGASDSANTITFSAAISLSTSLTTGGEPNVDLVYASQEQVLVCSYSTNGVYPKTQVLTVDVGNNSILTGPVVTAAGSSAAPVTNKLLYRADTNTLHQFYNVYHTSSVIRKFTAHRLAISTGAATERKIDFLTTVQGPTVGSQCGAVCLDPDSSKVVVVTSKSNGSQPPSAFLYDTQKPVSPTVFRNKSHYPLRNSATDPTSNDTASNNAYNWRLNSTPSGYTFIANKGIYSDGPITNMAYMFFYKSSFNDSDIALWDVSSVTNMEQTFFSCSNFNQNIGNWNVSNVTNMSSMFYYCSSFNQNIGNWNVSNVTNMSSMFSGCSAFNADIGSWNPSSATNMIFMFDYCTAFNQNLNSWNTTSMTIDTVPSDFASNSGLAVRNYPIFGRNFTNATYYPLRNYAPANNNDYPYNNTYWAGKPTTFTYVPYVGIIVENGDKITNCASMFYDNANFNDPDVSLWDMSTVTNMSSMFWANTSFNQDISNWDTSSVTTMYFMFYQCSNFNQNIGGWNTGAVTDMNSMLRECTNFNQDLSGWCVANITSEPFQFSGSSGLSTSNKPGWGTCHATGGTITEFTMGDTYKMHTFGVGTHNFVVRATTTLNFIVVAGGGGGGAADSGAEGAGGGGGGGYRLFFNQSKTSGTYTITVGAGGSGSTSASNNGANGADSSAFGYTATGGGGGGSKNNGNSGNGSDGGSGGGAGGAGNGTAGSGNTPATSPYSQGNDGGDDASHSGGGGGGGGAAGNPGGAGGYGNQAGAGGNGYTSNITGSLAYYAAGGGGGGGGNDGQGGGRFGGSGGTGGGGHGGSGNVGANAGRNAGNASGYGSGGGGGAGAIGWSASGAGYGGNGSAGVVIITYII